MPLQLKNTLPGVKSGQRIFLALYGSLLYNGTICKHESGEEDDTIAVGIRSGTDNFIYWPVYGKLDQYCNSCYGK